ncbi:MAG: hypothetical protein KQ78_01144 [Candidatus Izimaplasma bacterium HR2]|nr:MAG: hypothetical protein KQ78_01144 [Candidatus Izimaplasma bacterium HR2]
MGDRKQTNNILSVIFLIFFYPFGIPYMWVTKSFSNKTRWIITIYLIVMIVLGLAALILFTSSHGYRY